MNAKKSFKDIFRFAEQNATSRKEAVNLACGIIVALNNLPADRKLSEKELEKICGGMNFSIFEEEEKKTAKWW